MILHIPHSSTRIPYHDGYTVSASQLEEEQLLLTDWFTDDLFDQDDAIVVIADFSRIFCDVERFSDDAAEPMAKSGMGALYETRDDGTSLRNISPELRERILREYYFPHHQKLTTAVENQLKQYGGAMIIDCHSFPDIPFRRDFDQTTNRPDFNLGTDEFHTPEDLLKTARNFFQVRNFTVGINAPYSGSIVPMKYYRKNENVRSIMLEINRKLYLEPGTNRKSTNYSMVKEVVREFLNCLFDNCL